VYGVDVDFTARLSDRFTVGGGIEVIHDRFTSFPNADFFLGCPAGPTGVCSLSAKGNRLPQTPAFSGNINADYRASAFGGEFDANVNVAYNSKYYFAPDNELSQTAYAMVNASLSWTPGNKAYSVKLWGKNLTNNALPSQFNQTIGAAAIAYQPPRTYGATLGVKF
jgi:iron complex outermembrane receptor protein